MAEIMTDVLDAMRAAVAQQVANHPTGRPTYDLARLQAILPMFINHARNLVQVIRNDPKVRADIRNPQRREQLVQRLAEHLASLLTLHAEAWARLEAADLAHAKAPPGTVLYNAEAKEAAARLAGFIAQMRTALTDGLKDGSERSSDIRTRCGVGVPLKPDSPPDARRVARHAVDTLRQEDVQLHLRVHGITPEAFLFSLEDGLEELDAELNRSPGMRQGEAARLLDRAQLEVELICHRILVVVNEALGLAERDQLREHLPKSTFGQKRAERSKNTEPAPTTSGPTVTPKDAAAYAASEKAPTP